jgi:hypothetical protein
MEYVSGGELFDYIVGKFLSPPFSCHTYIYVVMEYVSGGELFVSPTHSPPPAHIQPRGGCQRRKRDGFSNK